MVSKLHALSFIEKLNKKHENEKRLEIRKSGTKLFFEKKYSKTKTPANGAVSFTAPFMNARVANSFTRMPLSVIVEISVFPTGARHPITPGIVRAKRAIGRLWYTAANASRL